MDLRALFVALPLLLPSGVVLAETDIGAVCYADCEAATHSNPEYKACLARGADKADAALNQAYKTLQDKIRSAAKEMGQEPDVQLSDLKDAQKQWLAYRDSNCTLEDSLAFGGTAIRRQLFVLPLRALLSGIDDFERIRKKVLGLE